MPCPKDPPTNTSETVIPILASDDGCWKDHTSIDKFQVFNCLTLCKMAVTLSTNLLAFLIGLFTLAGGSAIT